MGGQQRSRSALYATMCTCGCLLVAVVFMVHSRATVWPNEEEEHRGQFIPTTFTVQREGRAPYLCYAVTNCACSEAGAVPACGSLAFEGVCGNGYRCCREECDRCRSGGKGSSYYDCNCRCVSQVSDQRCYNDLGTCYTPWAEVRYTPEEPTAEMNAEHSTCMSSGGGTADCASLLTVLANVTTSCGIDNVKCVEEFEAEFTTGTASGVYDIRDYSSVHLEVPEWTPSAGLVAAIVVLSIIMCCSAPLACISLCAYLSTSKSPTRRIAAAAKHTTPAATVGVGAAPQAQPGMKAAAAAAAMTGHPQPAAAAGGYPPAAGGYPPGAGGYPPVGGGYPPVAGGVPPVASGVPPVAGGYPPAMGGFPVAGGYPAAGAPVVSYQPNGVGVAADGYPMAAPSYPVSAPSGPQQMTL